MTVIGLLFLHIVQLVLIFNLPSYFIIPGTNDTDNVIVKYLKGGAYFGILILIFFIMINKEKVLSVRVNHEEIQRGERF